MPVFALLGENALRVTLYAADPETSPLVTNVYLDGLRYPQAGRDQDQDQD
jgi:ATP-dependent DNA helicase RecG